MKKSEFLKLKSQDFWKGLIVAVLTAAVTGLSTAITNAADFASFNWQSVVLAAAGGFVAYILKNLFTNSEGEILKTEHK
jgi:zinc transporter ZupT